MTEWWLIEQVSANARDYWIIELSIADFLMGVARQANVIFAEFHLQKSHVEIYKHSIFLWHLIDYSK